ncbi:MAG: cupin domain-containing protein [Candidimonas sp.]|nr:MAG: cupin domain-containing protein [Candidimonas sp.]
MEQMMLIKSIREKVQFGKEHFQAIPLVKSGKSVLMAVGLEPGQAIPVHHPGSDVAIIVIEGELTLVSGDEELEHAGPGAVLYAEAGKARGIRADKRSIAVAMACPPPTQEDHREVAEHFAKGTWR